MRYTKSHLPNEDVTSSATVGEETEGFCDAEGKCSGDVTIADSVITGSNIA